MQEKINIQLRDLFLRFQQSAATKIENSGSKVLGEFIKICEDNNLNYETEWDKIEDQLYPK